VGGRRFQGLNHHLLDLIVGHRARAPGSRLVVERFEAMLGKAIAPLRHHRAMHPERVRDLGVRLALGRQQHDPRSLRERLGAAPAARPRLQLRPLVGRQLDRDRNRTRHNRLLRDRSRVNASGH